MRRHHEQRSGRIDCECEGVSSSAFTLRSVLLRIDRNVNVRGMQVAATGRGALAGDIIDALGKLARWPAEQLFPVLDIFRLLVLNASHARLLSYDAGELTADNPGLGGMLARGLSASAPAPSKLMAHRLACNCCAHPQLRSWLWARTGALFDAVADAAVGSNKAGRAALATLLLDYGAAVHRGEASGDDEHRVRALSMLCEVRHSSLIVAQRSFWQQGVAHCNSKPCDRSCGEMSQRS